MKKSIPLRRMTFLRGTTFEIRFANRLREMREVAGLTQGELAKKAKLSRATLAQWESGAGCDPRLSMLRRLAGALGMGVTVSTMMDVEDPMFDSLETMLRSRKRVFVPRTLQTNPPRPGAFMKPCGFDDRFVRMWLKRSGAETVALESLQMQLRQLGSPTSWSLFEAATIVPMTIAEIGQPRSRGAR